MSALENNQSLLTSAATPVTKTYRKTNRTFMRLLHGRRAPDGRRMTIGLLASLAGCDRCHVNKVLIGEAGRGFYTRRKLARVLTVAEMEALGWEKELFHIEHSEVRSGECGVRNGEGEA